MYIDIKKSIISLEAKNPWYTTTIMAGVHGNELAGIYALQSIISDVQITAGKVFIIFANLKALEQETREYENNMNRCFFKNIFWTTYEDKRVIEILPYLEHSDYLLDTHNTLSKVNSIPFLISEHQELDLYFDVEYSVSGLDQLHSGGSDGYMNSIGKIGLCLEVGSIYEDQNKTIQKATQWILNFLRFTGNIAGTPTLHVSKKRVHFDVIYKNTSPHFHFVKLFGDFEEVKKWEILWYDWENPVTSDRNGVIIFASWSEEIGWECFCLWSIVN